MYIYATDTHAYSWLFIYKTAGYLIIINFMKRLVIFLFSFILCFPLVNAKDIKLEPKDPPKVGNGIEFDRETIIVPTASVENGVINIETELASWGVAVTIYNSDGAVVYTSVSEEESKLHAFAVGTLPVDDYTLEVQIGDDYYEGEILID